MFHTKNKVIPFWYHECQTKNVFSGCRKVEGNSEDPAVRTAMMFEFCVNWRIKNCILAPDMFR